jgi:hypothetical protein
MKDKLRNQLGPHLEMIVHMSAQKKITQENFLYDEAITS